MGGAVDEGGLTLHNGQRSASATISLHDPIVTRGDGCFEAVRLGGSDKFQDLALGHPFHSRIRHRSACKYNK